MAVTEDICPIHYIGHIGRKSIVSKIGEVHNHNGNSDAESVNENLLRYVTYETRVCRHKTAPVDRSRCLFLDFRLT